jgi:hypothetical protein
VDLRPGERIASSRLPARRKNEPTDFVSQNANFRPFSARQKLSSDQDDFSSALFSTTSSI